jgi:hypothetical protein
VRRRKPWLQDCLSCIYCANIDWLISRRTEAAKRSHNLCDTFELRASRMTLLSCSPSETGQTLAKLLVPQSPSSPDLRCRTRCAVRLVSSGAGRSGCSQKTAGRRDCRRGELFTEQVLPRRDDGMLGQAPCSQSSVQRNLVERWAKQRKCRQQWQWQCKWEWVIVPKVQRHF